MVSTPCSEVISTAFGIDAGQIHVQQELVVFLVNVHRRQPRAGVRGGRLRRAEQAIEVTLEIVDERPGLITNDSHVFLLNKVRMK